MAQDQDGARAATDRVILDLGPDDVGRAWFGVTLSMRPLIHMVDETACHARYMDIVGMSSTGLPAITLRTRSSVGA